jgi:Tol biopolymer transport system component
MAEVEDPVWSPDGHTLAFGGTLDLVGEAGDNGLELFTVAFDTTGLAANGAVELNRNLHRVTYSPSEFGNPIDDAIRNYAPVFSMDGSEIFFVSSRRAPATTLYDRNIWRVVADGRLEPQIVFFSRQDDVDPTLDPVTGGLIICSKMGFPTEMLDRLEREAIERLEAENPDWSPVEIEQAATAERRELEFFAGVMSHIFVFEDF